MDKAETLLWLIALDYGSLEALNCDESSFLVEWWREMRDVYSVMR